MGLENSLKNKSNNSESPHLHSGHISYEYNQQESYLPQQQYNYDYDDSPPYNKPHNNYLHPRKPNYIKNARSENINNSRQYGSYSNYEHYPYNSNTYMNSHDYYYPAKLPTSPNKKQNEYEQTPQMPYKQHRKEVDNRTAFNQKPSQGQYPKTSNKISYKISSEEVSTKPSQLLLPIQENESVYIQSHEKFYHGVPFIPLIKEDENEGYDDIYLTDSRMNQRIINYQDPSAVLQAKVDSPSNYKPFGTHFGPRIVNKYGGYTDFFTPQNKQIAGQQYTTVLGDASSRSSPFKKTGIPSSKNQTDNIGFSSYTEEVLKKTN